MAAAMLFALSSMAQDISSEAQRYMIRGQVAMEDAKDISGFQSAVIEFKKATELAPDWGDAWFNLGVAQENAGDLAGAIQSYKKYVTLSPNAPDRTDVETQIIRLEYRHEKAEEERRKQQAAEAEKARLEQMVQPFRGAWITSGCLGKNGTSCNEKEANGTNWYPTWRDQAMTIRSEYYHSFPGDGTVILHHSHCGKIVGFPQGWNIADTKWEFWPENGQRRKVWAETEQGYIKISCDRPVDESRYNRKTRYRYDLWQKR